MQSPALFLWLLSVGRVWAHVTSPAVDKACPSHTVAVHTVTTETTQPSPGCLDLQNIPSKFKNYTYPPPSSLLRNYTIVQLYDTRLNGTFNVSYWVNDRGDAVLEGDIVYGPEAKLRAWKSPEGHAKRSFGVQRTYAWHDGIIRFKFESNETRNRHWNRFNRAINQWLSLAPYLVFKEEPVSDTKSIDVATIREGKGFSTTVGSVWDEEDFERYMIVDSSWSPLEKEKAYPHELGHLVGLFHEYSRPDRDKYVEFRCENVNPRGFDTTCPENLECCPGAKDESHRCCIRAIANLDFLKPPLLYRSAVYGPFDPYSVMTYTRNMGAKPKTFVFTYAGIPDSYYVESLLTGFSFLSEYYLGLPGWGSSATNFVPSIGDGATICGMYRVQCEAYWDHKLAENQIPVAGAAPAIDLLPGAVELGRPPNEIPPPAKPSIYTTGWTYSFPDYVFSINAYIPSDNFLVVDNAVTKNTKCLKLSAFTSTLPDGGVLAPAHTDMTFETGLPGQDLAADTCCLRYYKNDKCDSAVGEFEDRCTSTPFDYKTTIDTRSFQVYGCIGIWQAASEF